MGVQGLLKFVKSVTSDAHIGDYRGRTVAVDASSWLHRGARACAGELVRGEPTAAYLTFTLRMLGLFAEHGVRPLLVFDGGELPMKARQNRGRRESRGEHREAAAQLRAQGREREAWAQEQKGVSVSSAMVHATIAEIRARGVPFVVAPYEADAQLAHLVESGHAAAALTEDSDLLPFGCPRTLYKMEPSGGCELIEYSDLQNAEERGSHLFDGEWRDEWEAWSRDGLFVDMCVLAGTDYLPSIVGVGVKTAHRELRRARSLERAVPRLPNAPRGDDLADYLAQCRQARAATTAPPPALGVSLRALLPP